MVTVAAAKPAFDRDKEPSYVYRVRRAKVKHLILFKQILNISDHPNKVREELPNKVNLSHKGLNALL